MDGRPLPHLFLAVELDRRAGTLLTVSRDAGGSIETAFNRWPPDVPSGALLLHWPSRLVGSPETGAFFGRVRDAGGATFPLRTVVRRLGLSPGRGWAGILRVLIPDLDEVEDPHYLGRRLTESLAEHLAGVLEGPGIETVGEGWIYRPHPEVIESLDLLPSSPGTYSFLAREGTVLYVGKARNLRGRVLQHFRGSGSEPEKDQVLAEDARTLLWQEAGSELEALLLEYLEITESRPPLNTQENVHRRERGRLRDDRLLLFLPSVRSGSVEVCLVAGDGRFHWERVPQRRRLPHRLWKRIMAAIAGAGSGWGPGCPERPLTGEDSAALAEIALSWLARHGDAVTQIDLQGDTWGRALKARIRNLLAEDPAQGRVEVPGG